MFRGQVIVPLFCAPCSHAEDAVPLDFEPAKPGRSETRHQYDQRRTMADIHPGLFSSAEDILFSGELQGELLSMWEMFCGGMSLRKIALTTGKSRTQVSSDLGPLLVRCRFKTGSR
jgi:hypothetical protein